MTTRRSLPLHPSTASAAELARRDFLKLVSGLSLAACTRAPREDIVPYVVQPPEVTPGRARFYATAAALDGYGTGLLVESHEGRPTKVEGNPEHPASLGATRAIHQASILSLYDPHRARGVTEGGRATTWDAVVRALRAGAWTRNRGEGLRVVLEPTSSPTVGAMLATIRDRFPSVAVHYHAVADRRATWDGARLAFGRVLEPRYALAHADVVVALDADFLEEGPAPLRLARELADGRRVTGTKDAMNRVYAVEPALTVTGNAADHRLAVRASEVVVVAAALAEATGAIPSLPDAWRAAAAPHRRFVDAVANDLRAHRGRGVVIAGERQPAIVHALAHAIDAALGNLGTTVEVAPSPILEAGERAHDPALLDEALSAGATETLVVLDANLAYASAAERKLAARIAAVPNRFYWGAYPDETHALCTYTIAAAHPLESWGDVRAYDGTTSIVQPLVEPLFGARTVLDVLGAIAGGEEANASAYDRVRRELAKAAPGPDAEAAWRAALRRGVVAGTTIAAVPARVDARAIADALARTTPPAPQGLELALRLDSRVHDGRFTDNAWLVELPAPLSTLTWTNAATVAPETAAELGVKDGDDLALAHGDATLHAPVHVVAGQAPRTIALTLGWGRARGGVVAPGLGANGYALATRASPWMRDGIAAKKGDARHDLPFAQLTRSLEGRDESIARHGTLASYRAGAHADAREHAPPATLYELRPTAPRQWAMAIDLSLCTGCGACVVACQAENNVPTVGADGVRMGRIMHWLRIDQYAVGPAEAPDVLAQPMLCQHCEKAPCEYVCPVNATVHSTDGLNQMVYNRCVGTRFCSNNCPYKVRRFNWFDFHDGESATEQLAHNPDVTVRERGVMEKCTFCVQRIREHEIREATGETPPPLRTACEQACAARAIVFGDRAEPHGEVARLHQSDRAFDALGELGTLPRVRYLARLKNPNPELA